MPRDRRRFVFGLAILVTLWLLNIGMVTYLLHFRPDCARDQLMVPRGERALSGYTCRSLLEIETAP
jgi:hypothetical protein